MSEASTTWHQRIAESIRRDIRQWRLSHFVFDSLLTCAASLLIDVAWPINWIQLTLFAVLFFSTTASAILAFSRPASRRITIQDIEDITRALDIVRETQTLGHAMEMLRTFAELTPLNSADTGHDAHFKKWRSTVRAYIAGTLNERMVKLFDNQVKASNDPLAARGFLHGLVNNLTRSDLRVLT